MKVVGFAGFSGSGKTTLIERLIPALRQRGQRVSVVKHAHHKFDVDHPGKDTWRHREAGAFEVVAASGRRLVLMREFEHPPVEPTVHGLLAELDPRVDWVLVEGFKECDLPKVEVWKLPPDGTEPVVRYPEDPFIVAISTDAPGCLPVPTGLPVFDGWAGPIDALADWLIAQGPRFEYVPPPPLGAP